MHTIILGNFNARTGITYDFQHIYEEDELSLEQDPYAIYFKKEDIFHRKQLR